MCIISQKLSKLKNLNSYRTITCSDTFRGYNTKFLDLNTFSEKKYITTCASINAIGVTMS